MTPWPPGDPALASWCVLSSLYLVWQFARFDRELAGFDELLAKIDPGSCVAAFDAQVIPSVAFTDQRDLLRAALAPIAEEPLPPELNLSRIIENRARRPSVARWAMAAMLLLSIGGLGGWAVRGALQASPEGLVALAQEATASYNVYAPDRVRPVEVRASDSAQLVQWVSDRLHRPVKVPDLAASGFTVSELTRLCMLNHRLS